MTPFIFQPRIRQAVEAQLLVEDKLEQGYKKVFRTKEEARRRLMQPPVYLKELGIGQTYTEETADILLERGLEKVEGGYSFRRDIRLVLPSLYFIDFHDQSDQGKQIRCPHLLIKASKGPVSEYDAVSYENYQLNPGFQKVDVEGLHHAHMNQFQLVNQIIVDFLDNLDIRSHL